MDICKMREFISKEYPGASWRNRVKKMRDNQVIAIYYKMLDNRRNKEIQSKHVIRPRQHGKKDSMYRVQMYEQLSMFNKEGLYEHD